MVILFTFLGIVFFLAAIHPFVTYPLSLRLLRKSRLSLREALAPASVESLHVSPRFAICMCAYNEESVIDEKMRNLLALSASESVEILIYVDGSSDRTAEILRGYADRIRLFVSSERRGKTHGMNLLVAHAQAPLLVFTDANVMIDGDALKNLAPYFLDPRTGCVCGQLTYTNPAQSVTAASGALYWRLEEAIKRLEQNVGSVMGADGSLFAIRRALHRPPPEHLIDDFYVSMMILCDGYRIVQATDVKAYELSASSSTEEFRRKVRIACQAFNVHRTLWARIKCLDSLTVYMYVSHKLARWFTIYSLVLSLIFFLAALLAAGLWLIAAAAVGGLFAVLTLGHVGGMRPFNRIVDFLVALAGTGWGVWHSVRGKQYQTWTPAASIRKG